jgi:hypothetical protein
MKTFVFLVFMFNADGQLQTTMAIPGFKDKVACLDEIPIMSKMLDTERIVYGASEAMRIRYIFIEGPEK